MNFVRSKRMLSSLLSGVMVLSLLLPVGQAAAATQGSSVVDTRRMEIGPGAVYTWMNMSKGSGDQKVHMVEFQPSQGSLELQPGMTNGKVYGMEGVSKMAADVDREGNRVIAAVNADFYDMSTGIPLGLFMGEGEILNSPQGSRVAFGIKEDGTSLFGTPTLSRSVTINGMTSALSSINRMRGNEELVLYTDKFHTSTMTNDLGDEVVLDVVNGRVASGETLTMKVVSIHHNKGNSPLGANQVVLSASGQHRSKLDGLQIGDEVTASFELQGEWKDVTMAVGGNVQLVKDGVVQQHADPAIHPRTAIGTKADGSIVMFEIDGRQPGFSEGVNYVQLGEILQELGVVNAINLDGGGSSTFVARLPGAKERTVLNSPSDGGERKTANGILLVNKAPEGAADKLVVTPALERVLTGSTVSFQAAAVDANLHPAEMTGTPVWSVDSSVGSVDGGGLFRAGNAAGAADIKVQSGGLSGSARVEVVDELTELSFADTVKTFASGSTETLSVTALRNGQVVQADNSRFEWRTEGDIGIIDASGTFTATDEQGVTGRIYVKYGQAETSIEVNVGLPPVMLEDFENGLDRYRPSSGAQVKSTRVSIETEDTYVRSGNGSLKLEYDFTGMTGTSGAYLHTKTLDDSLQIPGYPEKISMWVYGDGNRHWLRAQLRDSKGAIPLDFTNQTTGVDFTGWRYLEATVPKGRELPLTMDMPVRYMETQAEKKDAGVIYVDEIRALYGPANDDIDPPVLRDFSPADGEVIANNTPTITVYAEDEGYDPVKNPGTTLIDPDKIRLYLDGSLVPHTLYPPEGRIHYTPGIPLADGVHQVQVMVRDMSGNQTSEEWHFTVDTGAARVVYDTPDTVYAGGTYTVDIGGVRTSHIRSGQVEFAFDMSKVENLELIPGGKLSTSQVQADINSTTGVVKVSWKDIDTAALNDQDLIGQIRYDVKRDAAGTSTIRLTSGAVSFVDTGSTEFSFYGLPLHSRIETAYVLSWNADGIVEGYETEFKLEDKQGLPVEGASILADGAEIGITNGLGILSTRVLTANVRTYSVQAVKDQHYSQAAEFTVSPLAGSPVPSNISVGMGEDPAESRMFAWHTDPGTTGTVVELAERSAFTSFDAPNVQRFDGSSELYHTLDLGTVRVHKATAAGLAPGTEYVYRVGDGQGHYSGEGTFKTADGDGERTKFLYFADSQAATANEFKLWGHTVDKAVQEHPDAEFMVHAGDMVDKGFLEEQWNHWFGAAQGHLMNTTLVSAIGNHEVMGTKENGDFLAHFNQPGNGLDHLKGTNFSFDYNNMHFVVLNSEYKLEDQKDWLERDLAHNDKPWTIAMFHRGPYGSIYDTAEVRELWAPVLEAHGVDLVLNGHDHIYVRSYPMKNKQISPDGKVTTYVVAGSTGPKFYSHTERGWHEVVDEEQTQMYASIEIVGDELRYVAKTIHGRIVDEFTLTKNDNVPVPERIEVVPDQLTLAVGESQALKATVRPERADASVVWSVYSSEPEQVIEVSADGIVTALGLGDAVVRATSVSAPGVYADVHVKVDRLPEGTVQHVELQGKRELQVGDTDVTVTEAVYTDGTRIRLTEGVVYASSRPDIASVSDTGVVHALAEGVTVIRATYDLFHAEYELRVRLRGDTPGVPAPNPPPAPPVAPPVQPPVQPPVAPPETPPVTPPGPLPSGSLTLTADDVTSRLVNGEARLVIDGAISELTLPGNAADLIGDGMIRIEASNAYITLPPELLRQLAQLAPAGQSDQGMIRLSLEPLSSAERMQRLAAAASLTRATLNPVGELLDLRLAWVDEAGNALNLSGFDERLTIGLPLQSEAGRRIGLYQLMDDGQLKYAGGVNEQGLMRANIKESGTYGLLDYSKDFADVPSSHWAADVIGDLAARQLVQGVSMEHFSPARTVTRAEFTAMLVRLLELQAGETSSFADVPGDKWYADAVAAAVQAGIIQGVTADRFAPDASITRQEMAVMLVRSFTYAAGQREAAGTANVPFSDIASSPAWAQESIEQAYALGLVQGRGASRFEPSGLMTRAESAQVIYNLLYELKVETMN
ncbi:metallophosphoesterase [Paenibacillus campinasensis]|uniref:Metallophosphoesterase n=1 Tax=Paenibacillus campinasensis TaxID=66347 RepID=A0ABW9T1K4_9BACL|nr:phosphodiester glycosidase family protein [Paenibacillus campinasensis]MUG67173.1 metallophosphoesterase [Paenibacillus campinasensis]